MKDDDDQDLDLLCACLLPPRLIQKAQQIHIAAAVASSVLPKFQRSSTGQSCAYPMLAAWSSTSSSSGQSPWGHLHHHHQRSYSTIPSSHDADEQQQEVVNKTISTKEPPSSSTEEGLRGEENIIDSSSTSFTDQPISMMDNYNDEFIHRIIALSTTEGPTAALAELGSWPSDYAIRLIELLHTTTGMPYWSTIIMMTLLLRTLLFPMVIKTSKNVAKMTLMRPGR